MVGWCEIERDLDLRKRELGTQDRRTCPIAGFSDRLVGQSADGEPGQALPDVSFDANRVTLRTDDDGR